MHSLWEETFLEFCNIFLILMPLVDNNGSTTSIPSLSLDSPISSWKMIKEMEKEDGKPQRKGPAANNTWRLTCMLSVFKF